MVGVWVHFEEESAEMEIKFDIKNTTMGEITCHWEAVVWHRKLSSVYCDDLDV